MFHFAGFQMAYLSIYIFEGGSGQSGLCKRFDHCFYILTSTLVKNMLSGLAFGIEA